jgi:hypothetical protein
MRSFLTRLISPSGSGFASMISPTMWTRTIGITYFKRSISEQDDAYRVSSTVVSSALSVTG